MDRYTLARLKEGYSSSRERELQASYPGPSYSSRLYPSPYSPHSFGPHGYQDLFLLKELLAPQTQEYATLADQVFGSQAQRERLSLQQLTQLLYERALIHTRHLRDIQHRHMDCQERLSIARILTKDPDSRGQANLERLLVQLEKDSRDEESAFWKDTSSLRKEVLEKAGEYKAARNRWLNLGSLEMNYG